MNEGFPALVAVRERGVEGALAAVGHRDNGGCDVGSGLPDTGGEALGGFFRAEGALELVRRDDDAHGARPSRAEFTRFYLSTY